MNPEELKKISKETDPDQLGSSLENKKEAVVDEMSARDKAAAQMAQDRKDRAKKRVGIRTYRDYAADELKKGGGTLTKMIVQEREKEREQKRHSVKNSKNIAISFLALVFVVAGIGIVALSYILVTQSQANKEQKDGFIVAPKPLVVSDFRKEIYIANPTRPKINRAVEDEIEDTAIPVGTIKHVYLVQDGTTELKELTSSGAFFRAMESQIPSSLTRSIDPLFMYGFYSSTEVAPFLIFTSSSFSNAYAGLLEWEQDIVRVLLDPQGEILFGYGFLQDKETIVFFDNRLTLREIITRNQRNTIKE